MLEHFHALFSSDYDLFSSNQRFRKKSFRNTTRVANSLDPNHARHFVGNDLGPNCLQRLSVRY